LFIAAILEVTSAPVLPAIAICHNVTPVYDKSETDDAEDLVPRNKVYQASSPDEVGRSSA